MTIENTNINDVQLKYVSAFYIKNSVFELNIIIQKAYLSYNKTT
jgi:hypothetical protein